MKLVYPALITPTDSGGYFIKVPDINSCITTGKTLEEALDNIRDALGGCLCVLEDVSQPLPKPSAPAAVCDGQSTVILVDIDLLEYRKETETKAIRKNLACPARQISAE